MEEARNVQINLIGEKVPDPVVHCCFMCDLPIRVYGRLLSCKHVYCYDCASRMGTGAKCSRCQTIIDRIEKLEPSKVHVCGFGAPKHSREACGKTYLSQRDLQAHTDHRHRRDKTKSGSSAAKSAGNSASNNSSSNLISIPLQKRNN